MKILFTGASSFTGMWFVQELAKKGHEITATFLHPLMYYQGLRKERIERINPICKPIYDCPFGSTKFNDLITSQHWDILCHHAADVTNYKSPDFDFAEALRKNTLNIKEITRLLKQQGCNKILLTGSVFEQREGASNEELSAISPYGLSKGLTSDVFRYFCGLNDLHLGKFVIPNPFGPYEEMRFTSYLAQNWLQKKEAIINTPEYVRDNIPVNLLALCYVQFVENLPSSPKYSSFNPSFRPESQGQFTERLANEMRKCLQLPCLFYSQQQTEFREPKIRINTDKIQLQNLQWIEEAFWKDLAAFYIHQFQPSLQI